MKNFLTFFLLLSFANLFSQSVQTLPPDNEREIIVSGALPLFSSSVIADGSVSISQGVETISISATETANSVLNFGEYYSEQISITFNDGIYSGAIYAQDSNYFVLYIWGKSFEFMSYCKSEKIAVPNFGEVLIYKTEVFNVSQISDYNGNMRFIVSKN